MSTVVSLICLGPSFQKMTHHFLLHGSLWPTNLENNLKPCLLNEINVYSLHIILYVSFQVLPRLKATQGYRKCMFKVLIPAMGLAELVGMTYIYIEGVTWLKLSKKVYIPQHELCNPNPSHGTCWASGNDLHRRSDMTEAEQEGIHPTTWTL